MAKDVHHQHEKRKPTANVRWVYDLLAFPYIPRKEPHPVPAPGGVDAPSFVMEVNALWLSHVLGALSVLEQRDAWKGDDDEIYHAQQQIEAIIASIQSVTDFLNEARDLFRVHPDNAYIIQRLNLETDEYENWFVLGNVAVKSDAGSFTDFDSYVRSNGYRTHGTLQYGDYRAIGTDGGLYQIDKAGVPRVRLQLLSDNDVRLRHFDLSGNFERDLIHFRRTEGITNVGNNVYVPINLDVGGTKNFLITHPVDNDKLLRYAAIEAPQAYLTHMGTVTLQNGAAVVDLDAAFGLDQGTLNALMKNNGVRVWLQAGSNQQPTGKLVYRITAGGLQIADVAPTGTPILTSTIEVHWQLTGIRDDVAIRASDATDSDGNLINQIAKSESVDDALLRLRNSVDEMAQDGQPREAVERFIKQALHHAKGWGGVGDVPVFVREKITAYLDTLYEQV